MHSDEYEMLKYPKFDKYWNLVACLIKTLEEKGPFALFYLKFIHFRCKEFI